MRVQYPKLRNMAHTTSLLTFSLLPKILTLILRIATYSKQQKMKQNVIHSVDWYSCSYSIQNSFRIKTHCVNVKVFSIFIILAENV